MADLRALVEFIVAIVSAYFLIKIENVKQQKDIVTLQNRVDRLEQKSTRAEKVYICKLSQKASYEAFVIYTTPRPVGRGCKGKFTPMKQI